ncbi:MAG: efflux RND transporter periplasmic adaptor subunit [Hyphomicrobiales bacterium]|nr:efflux RND transporter periplasmic adaptor subunit [Hyphomicrobiales bacterium]
MAQRRSGARAKKDAKPSQPRLVGRIQFILFALLLGGAGALWFSRDQVSAVVAGFASADQAGEPARLRTDGSVPVVVAKAGQLANDVIVGAIGTGRAQRSVMIYPEATGEIRHVFVRSGARISKGQPILRLDSSDAELAVKVARTRLVEAGRLLKRSRQLRDKKVNSQANVDDSRTLVDRAELELQQAEEAFSDREVKAPFDGVVGISKVELGDRVSPATPIVTLDDRSQLIVEFEVAEQFLSKLRIGQKVAVQTPSFPKRTFEGLIKDIDSRIDPTSRTVIVRANIPNNEDLLRPGLSFVVDFVIPGRLYTTVHELALRWRKGESYVWRVTDNKAERVVVRSVKRLNNTILIEGDISEGDLVVVEGVQRLRPGRPVRFSMPDPAPSS